MSYFVMFGDLVGWVGAASCTAINKGENPKSDLQIQFIYNLYHGGFRGSLGADRDQGLDNMFS